MLASDRQRSRSPRSSRGPICDTDGHLQVFLAAASRLLQHERIPEDALNKCKEMLERDRADTVVQASPLADVLPILIKHCLKHMLNSRMLCRLSATSRCFSDVFQAIARKHGVMFDWVADAPRLGPCDVVSVQQWQYHSALMLNILNGNVNEVRFIAQLDVDVNRVERGHDYAGHGGCDMCVESNSKLLKYSFYEVAYIMANSETPSPERKVIRDFMQHCGGHSGRRLPTKQRFLQHLHEPFGHESERCRLVQEGFLNEDD